MPHWWAHWCTALPILIGFWLDCRFYTQLLPRLGSTPMVRAAGPAAVVSLGMVTSESSLTFAYSSGSAGERLHSRQPTASFAGHWLGDAWGVWRAAMCDTVLLHRYYRTYCWRPHLEPVLACQCDSAMRPESMQLVIMQTCCCCRQPLTS